jgi:hypothetical protein
MKAEMLASRNVTAMTDEIHLMFLPEREQVAELGESVNWDIDKLSIEERAERERNLDIIDAHQLLFTARHESTREGWSQKVRDGEAEWWVCLMEMAEMLDSDRIKLSDLALTHEDLPRIALQAAFYEGWKIYELLREGELPSDYEIRLRWLYDEFLRWDPEDQEAA